jgi:hypothetical protein
LYQTVYGPASVPSIADHGGVIGESSVLVEYAEAK